MRHACGLTVLGWLILTSMAGASDSNEIAVAQLPREVTENIKDAYPGAPVVRARKEVDRGKECYVVSIMYTSRLTDLYASSDGRVIALKEEVFSLNEIPAQIMDSVLFLLLPGLIAGASLRWFIQVAKGNKLPMWLEWFSAWIGAAIYMGVLLLSMATIPREKDVVIIGLLCFVWGTISASIVEAFGLTLQAIRGRPVGCRRWIFGFCIVALVFFLLSFPVRMLSVARENEYFKRLAQR